MLCQYFFSSKWADGVPILLEASGQVKILFHLFSVVRLHVMSPDVTRKQVIVLSIFLCHIFLGLCHMRLKKNDHNMDM